MIVATLRIVITTAENVTGSVLRSAIWPRSISSCAITVESSASSSATFAWKSGPDRMRPGVRVPESGARTTGGATVIFGSMAQSTSTRASMTVEMPQSVPSKLGQSHAGTSSSNGTRCVPAASSVPRSNALRMGIEQMSRRTTERFFPLP